MITSQASLDSAAGHSLVKQWKNPSDATSLLMVIGGDVVQKALAAGTGSWFTPVCFSFGWVSYAFVALINIIGNGRLMPEPDCPVKLINLKSGYTRENKNWALGRFLRDCESQIARESQTKTSVSSSRNAEMGSIEPSRCAIRITIYTGKVDESQRQSNSLPMTPIHAIGLLCTLLQLGIAAIPVGLAGEWDIMMITAVGTCLVQLVGVLPQWNMEKVPSRVKQKPVALTRGNGSQDIIVIIGDETCWDLEAFAAPQNPRTVRIWESLQSERPRGIPMPQLGNVRLGFPIGYWITLCVVASQSVLWLAILVNVTAERGNNWYLVAIGLIGVFQNAYVAGMERDASQLKLTLDPEEPIEAAKVMDGIMDFEVKFGLGKHLINEFFPGDLRQDEKLWWDGQRSAYDDLRDRKHDEDKTKRTPSMSRLNAGSIQRKSP